MKSSFNAYGKTKDEFGNLTIPVWLGTVEPIPVGGTVKKVYLKPGVLFPAGTPICIASKEIVPLISFEVVDFTEATGSETDDKIVVKPCLFGKAEFVLEADDVIMVLGDTFASTGKAAVVKSVTKLTSGDNEGCYEVAVLHSATIDEPSAGDVIVISASEEAGSGKAMANQPNAYLYNDIYLGPEYDVTDETVAATGAAVMFHQSGILIDRTPAAAVKKQMAAVCPGVYQHNE
ncbi:MAG: hypothetical protein IJK99_09285 [Bacteroidales bacterium]|nr:hypothetical protein [Bacteroidales bacterium]